MTEEDQKKQKKLIKIKTKCYIFIITRSMFFSLPQNFSDSSSSSSGSEAAQRGMSDDSSDDSIEDIAVNAITMATSTTDFLTNSIVASFATIKNKAKATTAQTSELAARVFDVVMAPKGPGSGNGPRRPRRQYNRERAVLCIEQDWLGPEPLFRDGEFQRQFRVTKDIFRRMEQELPFHNSFFRPVKDAVKTRKPIDPRVKMICALKGLAFGMSAISNTDYLQISPSTAGKCVVQFCTTLVRKSCFSDVYLHDMNAFGSRKCTNESQALMGSLERLIVCMSCGRTVRMPTRG